jgi:DNA-binding NtrC family response regulator
MPRILIVDDDRDTCRVIAEVLAAPGREFEFASESERAVQLARTEPFDLVISDINLNSSMNGLDVLRAFKGANPDGQVLLISGFGTLQTAIEAVRAGAFDYISKPFDIEEVKNGRASSGRRLAARQGADRTHARNAGRVQTDRPRRRLCRSSPHCGRERHWKGARRPSPPSQ